MSEFEAVRPELMLHALDVWASVTRMAGRTALDEPDWSTIRKIVEVGQAVKGFSDREAIELNNELRCILADDSTRYALLNPETSN